MIHEIIHGILSMNGVQEALLMIILNEHDPMSASASSDLYPQFIYLHYHQLRTSSYAGSGLNSLSRFMSSVRDPCDSFRTLSLTYSGARCPRSHESFCEVRDGAWVEKITSRFPIPFRGILPTLGGRGVSKGQPRSVWQRCCRVVIMRFLAQCECRAEDRPVDEHTTISWKATTSMIDPCRFHRGARGLPEMSEVPRNGR
ncbi:hypothetical protein C8Q79DRAFT_141807 [Trametes meyenii]|nr:hypothetical protein C8Q79DRAFT_141807 [Trametes meyenii]